MLLSCALFVDNIQTRWRSPRVNQTICAIKISLLRLASLTLTQNGSVISWIWHRQGECDDGEVVFDKLSL